MEERKRNVLTFSGVSHFRFKLVAATLTGIPCKIEDIHSDSENPNPGLKDFEICFLRLMEKVTNGSEIRINETGAFI